MKLGHERYPVFLLLLIASILICACKQQPEAQKSTGFTSESSAEGLQVSMHVASDTITTSELVQVELIVRYAESLKLIFPENVESSGQWGAFRVFESQQNPAKLDRDGMVVESRIYTLEPDVPGEIELPSLVIKAVAADGKEVMVKTDSVSVKVESVLKAGENQIRDIAPNDREQAESKTSRWWFVIVPIILIIFALRMHSKKNNVEPLENHALEDFKNLKTAPVNEVIMNIERAVCGVLARQNHLNLSKVDFEGLQGVLNIPELPETVAEYERLRYASQPASESQVRELYSKFAKIIEKQAKEMGA